MTTDIMRSGPSSGSSPSYTAVAICTSLRHFPQWAPMFVLGVRPGSMR